MPNHDRLALLTSVVLDYHYALALTDADQRHAFLSNPVSGAASKLGALVAKVHDVNAALRESDCSDPEKRPAPAGHSSVKSPRGDEAGESSIARNLLSRSKIFTRTTAKFRDASRWCGNWPVFAEGNR